MKNLTANLLGFLLFAGILVFGVLFTIRSTVLSPQFINDRVEKIDTVRILDDVVTTEGSGDTSSLIDGIKTVITQTEPVVKEKIGVAVDSVYDYLLGKKTSPNIKGTLKDSFFNETFIGEIADEIDLAAFIDSIQQNQTDENKLPDDFMNAFRTTIVNRETDIKTNITEFTAPVFQYLLGETQDIDLRRTLRDTVLDDEFVTLLLEETDVTSEAQAQITALIINQLPAELNSLATHVPAAVENLKPALEAQINDNAGVFLDYILGIEQRFSFVISLDTVIVELNATLKDEFVNSPPPEYAHLTPEEREQYYDTNISDLINGSLPSTYTIDENVIDPQVASSFSGSITDMEASLNDIRISIDEASIEAENQLIEVRKYVSYFQLVFILFIVFIVLITIGIILVLRDVKSITRKIGVPLLIYGMIEYFIGKGLQGTGIPPAMEEWTIDLINGVMKPLEIFSICLLVTGLTLTVISFVYKRKNNQADMEQPTVQD
jgi:hypothetical protein